MFVAVTSEGDWVGPADDIDSIDVFCPDCREPVVLKAGELIEHHFAHLAGDGTCGGGEDSWHEPMSAWHRNWQRWFSDRGCLTEHVAGNEKTHRADVVLPDGAVLEVQHSALDVRDIAARERFWRPMLWMWDARRWMGTVRNQTGASVSQLSWAHTDRTGTKWNDSPDIPADTQARLARSFKWRRPARSLTRITEPLFWDCGPMAHGGIWWVDLHEECREYDGRPYFVVIGLVIARYQHNEFLEQAIGGRWSAVGPELAELSAMFRNEGIGVEEAVL